MGKTSWAWLLGFIASLFRVAPVHTVMSVWVSLGSQLCQIIAFLLPLKVMILIGSSDVPSYFPTYFIGFEREGLILLLSGISIFLYVLHLVADFVGVKLSGHGSERLIFLPCDGEKLKRQRKIALSYYRGAVVIIGGTLLSLGVMAFLLFFSQFLLAVVLGYFVAVVVVAMLLLAFYPGLRGKLVRQFSRLIDVLSGCGFLLVFAVLVFSFLYGGDEEILLGILILMLCRQMFSRLAMALKSFVKLYGYSEKAELAFGGWGASSSNKNDGGVWVESSEKNTDLLQNLNVVRQGDGSAQGVIVSAGRLNFWTIVSPRYSAALAREALKIAGVKFDDIEFKQLEANQCRELLLEVSCSLAGGVRSFYLFRVLGRKQTEVNSRSVALFKHYAGTIAVNSVAVIEWNGFSGVLYEWGSEVLQANSVQQVYLCREQAFIELAGWPSFDSLQAFSSESLVDRCDSTLWSWCKAFSHWLDTDTQNLVLGFRKDAMRLQQALAQLPKCLYNPDIQLGNIRIVDGSFKLLNWENWTLEPVGSGWPLELGWERLEMAFELVCERNANLRDISFTQLRLAALAFAFEARCAQGLYLSAFQLLPELRATLDVVDC